MEEKSGSMYIPQGMSFPQQVHLTDYIHIIRRRKWTVILFFLAVIGIVATISFMSTPIYKATTQIIIEDKPSLSIGMGDYATNDYKQQDYYQTQYNLLRSRSLVYRVIEDMELWKEIKFNKTDKAHTSISGLDNTGGLVDKEESKPRIERMLVDWYLTNLQITPVRGSRLVDISFLGSSPELVTQIVNTHAYNFIVKNIQTQKSSAQQALDWLKTQLQDQKAKVEASQRAIFEYKKKNNIVSLEQKQNIVSQKLMELNTALTRAKTERLAKEAIYKQMKDFSINHESLFTLPEISRDSVIMDLRASLSKLKAQRLEMETRLGPKFPNKSDLGLNIKHVEDQLENELQRLRKSIRADMDRAVAVEKSIQEILDAQKHAAMALSEKEISYDVLQQQAESNQHIYDILLKQAKEISLTSVMDSSNVRIVDEAEIPNYPVKPRIFLNILLAVVLGLFMGTGLAFFREYMDNTLKVPEDVKRRLGMPVLGAIPYDKSFKTQKTLALPGDISDKDKIVYRKYPFYNIANRLPVALQLAEKDPSGQVLVVESATMGEGKTTVLAHLAASMARSGLRALMMDCDLQRPALHQIFGINDENGLVIPMNRILSQQITSGSLNDFSIDDLFFLIGLKKRSGQMTVMNETQTMTAVFQNGRLLHIDNKDNPLVNRLGTMLLRGGFINKDRLKEALERHQRTGQPLGYILINAGYITQDKLQGPLRLQMEEHLQKLFSWKHGSFTFKPGTVEIYENEKIFFEEDYRPIIRRLGHLSGNRFLEKEILSCIKSLQGDNAYVLTAGTAHQNGNGQINPILLAKLLDMLKRRFDVILIDAPPIMDSAGSEPLCAVADGAIFVVKAGHLSVKVLNQAKNSLQEAKVNIIGAVLNQVKIRQDYYYGYR